MTATVQDQLFYAPLRASGKCPVCAGVGELEATDMFCGAGGSSLGLEHVCCPACGRQLVRVTQAVNHWDLAVEAHNANFPHADHDVHDAAEVPASRFRRTPLLWASPECFPAGTLILTSAGLRPIDEVREGDLVLTHRNRWRRVTATMKSVSSTVVVRGHGHSGIEVTPGHPFLASDHTGDHPSTWTNAGDLAGKYWTTPLKAEPLPIPSVPGRNIEFTREFWWMVGRWLGDGSLRYERHVTVHLPPLPRRRSQPSGAPCIVCGGPARPDLRSSQDLMSPYCSAECKQANKRHARASRGDISICCGKHEADVLQERLEGMALGLRWGRRELRTATLFTAAHIGLVEWLRVHFGQGSAAKTLPTWSLGMPTDWQESLLAGYVSADGSDDGRKIQTATVSRRLALGVRLLAKTIVVAAPPSVLEQWRAELDERFGLGFEILDRAYVARVRRERGFGVNPWLTHSRFLVSHNLLGADPMRAWLGGLLPSNLLILGRGPPRRPVQRRAVRHRDEVHPRDPRSGHFEPGRSDVRCARGLPYQHRQRHPPRRWRRGGVSELAG